MLCRRIFRAISATVISEIPPTLDDHPLRVAPLSGLSTSEPLSDCPLFLDRLVACD